MAIRLRMVEGEMIALCAAHSNVKNSDIYLDDAAHHALTEKFCRDFAEMGFIKNKKLICPIHEKLVWAEEHEERK